MYKRFFVAFMFVLAAMGLVVFCVRMQNIIPLIWRGQTVFATIEPCHKNDNNSRKQSSQIRYTTQNGATVVVPFSDLSINCDQQSISSEIQITYDTLYPTNYQVGKVQNILLREITFLLATFAVLFLVGLSVTRTPFWPKRDDLHHM